MPWYLSGQSFMTRLKLAWKELVKGTMNIGKMKRVSLQRTWVRKRTKYQMCIGRHGIQVGHKPCGTLRQLLMPPKGPLPRSDVVYRADCKGCTAYYVGETRKTLQSQISKHQGAVRGRETTSFIWMLPAETCHRFDFENAKAVDHDRFNGERIWAWICLQDHKQPVGAPRSRYNTKRSR